MGFEQRIQDRRFKALLESLKGALAAGDVVVARAALDEARELRPASHELDVLEIRLNAIPPTPASSSAASARLTRARALGGAALLLLGVSLVTGLDYLRSAPLPGLRQEVPPAPVLPAAAPTVAEVGVETTPSVTPRAIGTSGPEALAEEEIRVPASLRPTAAPEPLPSGETPDDFVYPAPAEAFPRSSRNIPLQPISIPARPTLNPAPMVGGAVTSAPPSALAPAAAAPSAALQDTRRVNDVLNSYARAYTALDASAARQVWPSVNERALSRAFASLASQDVSFDDCRIDVRGVAATAECRGRASYAGKVGSREVRTEARQWHFELRRDGEDWKIETAETRR